MGNPVRNARSGPRESDQLNVWPVRCRQATIRNLVPAIATSKPEQWETFLASAADRDVLESTWQEWNTSVQKLIAELEAKNIDYVLVELDLDEINDFCRQGGIPNNGQARSQVAGPKARERRQEE
jgi:hypothetical protein